MSCYFLMECRRWASSRSAFWSAFFCGLLPSLVLLDGWVDGLGRCPRMIVGMRVSHCSLSSHHEGRRLIVLCSIVEYATREQAQQAVNSLSNQNLMGRLVYVREVSRIEFRVVRHRAKMACRIVSRNLDLSGPQAATVADTAAPWVSVAAAVAPACLASTRDTVVLLAAALVAAVVKSTWPMCVYHRSHTLPRVKVMLTTI